MKKYSRSVFVFAALGAAFCQGLALAQDAPDGSQGDGEEPITAIAEIVVRGKPLNETHTVNVGAFGERDLMDIPLSIQNYSAEEFQSKAARTLLDVLQNDPSVQSASVGGAYDNLRLRGFQIDFTNTLRRDGLSLAPYQDVALENVERIDLLKGPSGFLYGFNSPGGSVNYIPKRPTDTPFWTVGGHLTSLEGRYVSFDTSQATASGFFGARVNGAYEKDGDFDHAADLERKFIGVATDFRIREGMVLQLNADYQDSSRIADPLLRADQGARADPLDPATYIEPPHVDRRDLLSPSWFRYNAEAQNIDAKLDIKFADDWFAVIQGNYSQNTRDQAFQDLFDIAPNGDIGAGSALFYTPDQRYIVTTAQAFVGGKFSTGPIQHDIFTGVASKKFTNRRTAASFPEIHVGNILNPIDPAEFDFGPAQFSRQDKIREKSVSFSDLVTFNEQWQALFGGRYIEYDSLSVNALGAVVPNTDFKQHGFAPSAGLVFKPVPHVTTYASYSRGFEQGAFAPFNAINAGDQTPPLESEQLELGVKAEIGHKFDFGVALFEIEREAAFLRQDNLFVHDGKVKHQGVEAIVSGRVTEHLKLAASVAFLDTELSNVADESVLGKRSQGVPEWTGSLSAEYAVPALKGLSLGAALTYADDRPVDAQNSGFIDSYTIVDATIGYATKWGEQPVRLRLNAKNLFNEYYYSSALDGGLSVGGPREIILSVSTDF